jgi:hypothetical protein
MPNTLPNPTTTPVAAAQPAPRTRCGDVIALLIAPVFAVGYHLAVTVLKLVGRRAER